MNECVNDYVIKWTLKVLVVSIIQLYWKTAANWYKFAIWGARAVEGSQCLFNLIFQTIIEQVLNTCLLYIEFYSWSSEKIHSYELMHNKDIKMIRNLFKNILYKYSY